MMSICRCTWVIVCWTVECRDSGGPGEEPQVGDSQHELVVFRESLGPERCITTEEHVVHAIEQKD